MWQELTSVIDELNKSYEALVRLGEKKQTALASLDMKGLESLLGEEARRTKAVRELEERRKQVLTRLAATEERLSPDAQMKDVIALAPKDLARRLRQAHEALGKNAARAAELSDNNRFLAEHALGAVMFHLNRIGGAKATGEYGSSGGEHIGHAQNFEFKA